MFTRYATVSAFISHDDGSWCLGINLILRFLGRDNFRKFGYLRRRLMFSVVFFSL